MELSYKPCAYPACDHVKKTEPDTSIDKDVLEKFLRDSDVLPLAESKTYAYIRLRHCSLVSNEWLRCRWIYFKEKAFGRKRTPFVFPDVKDYHFYLYQTRYAPAQSLSELVRGAGARRPRHSLSK